MSTLPSQEANHPDPRYCSQHVPNHGDSEHHRRVTPIVTLSIKAKLPCRDVHEQLCRFCENLGAHAQRTSQRDSHTVEKKEEYYWNCILADLHLARAALDTGSSQKLTIVLPVHSRLYLTN